MRSVTGLCLWSQSNWHTFCSQTGDRLKSHFSGEYCSTSRLRVMFRVAPQNPSTFEPICEYTSEIVLFVWLYGHYCLRIRSLEICLGRKQPSGALCKHMSDLAATISRRSLFFYFYKTCVHVMCVLVWSHVVDGRAVRGAETQVAGLSARARQRLGNISALSCNMSLFLCLWRLELNF